MRRTDAPSGGRLPVELTSFVGRRQDLAEVKRLLGQARLVTLTGVGGTGKTRLAARVAAELRRAFPDGVGFVDLTALRVPEVPVLQAQEPDGLAYLVIGALGLREQSGPARPVEQLVEHLAGRRALLVLDNCEHLLPACAVLADRLLGGCPGLKILATSREPLLLEGETLFAVPPLPVPGPGSGSRLAEVERCESVALFAARARAVAPDFALTQDDADVVAELCRRLDGLPLALELAAARVRVLSPAQILQRLTKRYALLSRGSRTAPERQQTLRASVEWSFDLCAKPERLLWARSAVFVGGFELDAVEGICADEKLPAGDLLDVMAGLVEKSILVRADSDSGTARYRMLETLRDYGQEKLQDSGESDELRRRHRDWHQELVARAGAEWVSDRQADWMARLGREHPNLRAAVEFCLTEVGEAEAALHIGTTLPIHYWWTQGGFGEGRHWLERGLAQVTAPTALRARALVVGSHLAFVQGDATAAMPLLDEGEELAHRLGGTVELAYTDYIRGLGAMLANDLPLAVDTLIRARTTLSDAPDPGPDLYLSVLLTLGTATGLAGDPRAIACQQEMLAVVEPLGEGLYRSIAMWTSGLITWLQGDDRQSATQLLEALRLKSAFASHDQFGIALSLELLAWITADQQAHVRAATLLGGADGLFAQSGTSITAFKHLIDHHDACERQTREALGDSAFTDAFGHGQTLTLDEVLAYALEQPRHPATPKPVTPSSSLTRREQQVAALIAEGLSNKEIAARLVISQRTAEGHVENILVKLGFANRAQVAAWTVAQA
jgi:predicted ATPase/DNA-binding NarL/FixJ family response regulator